MEHSRGWKYLRFDVVLSEKWVLYNSDSRNNGARVESSSLSIRLVQTTEIYRFLSGRRANMEVVDEEIAQWKWSTNGVRSRGHSWSQRCVAVMEKPTTKQTYLARLPCLCQCSGPGRSAGKTERTSPPRLTSAARAHPASHHVVTEFSNLLRVSRNIVDTRFQYWILLISPLLLNIRYRSFCDKRTRNERKPPCWITISRACGVCDDLVRRLCVIDIASIQIIVFSVFTSCLSTNVLNPMLRVSNQ